MMAGGEYLLQSVVPIYVRTGPPVTAGSHFGAAGADPSNLVGRRLDSVTVEVFYAPTSGSLSRRTLEIRLTDANDPFFYWQCSMSEEEYFGLKREQNLLVDFNRFAYKLIELLQQCLNYRSGGTDEYTPQFTATLTISEDLGGRPASAQLTISESTSFKQLVHLGLRLTTPSEPVLRKHLGKVLRQYQSELFQLRTVVGNVAGAGANIPTRIDLSRQPSMPVMMSEPPPAGVTNSRPEDRLRYLEEQNQQLNSQKMALEAELADLYRRHNISRPMNAGPVAAAPTTITCDINKANEIIRKLQDEVKSLRNRARAAEASVRQLEKVSKETGSSYESLTNELHQARGGLEEKSKALAEVTSEKERLARELEESKRLVEANEKVIEWLHQQINEDSLSRLLGSSTTAAASPGTTYRYSGTGNNILPSWLRKGANAGAANATTGNGNNNQLGGTGAISSSSSSPL